MTALCATRPADWWEVGSDMARLAMALCRVCPAPTSCFDPNPDGMIVAGVPYGERGRPIAVCECGFPMRGEHGRWVCRRCTGPGYEAYRSAILRWHAGGETFTSIGRRFELDGATISAAIRRWTREDKTWACPRSPSSAI